MTKAERIEFEETPSDYAVDFVDVEFPTRGGGVDLKGWYIPRTEENAPTIIFVHGLNNNRAGDGAVGLAARLLEQGFGSLLFDLRAHGTSDDGEVSGGYFEQNDVLGAFDYLLGKGISKEDIGVIGFSMGAGTAILAAAQEPEIRSLIVDSPYADVSDLLVQEVRRQTPLPDWMVPMFVPGVKFMANVLYGVKVGELVPEDAIADIDYPVMVIHGLEDTRIPSDHGVRVHANARATSQLWLVPDIEHMDSFLTHPEEYTEKVLAYFHDRR